MLFLSSYRCRGLPLAAMLSLSLIPALIPSLAQAQGRAREVGSLQVGTTLLWVRATDQGVVELFSAQGYRNMFTKPIMLLPEKVARFAYAVDHATPAVPDTVHPVTIEAGNLGDSTLRVRSTLGGPAPNLVLDFTADPTTGKVVLKGEQASQLLTTLADAAQATREMSPPVVAADASQVASAAPSMPAPVTAAAAAPSVVAPAPATMVATATVPAPAPTVVAAPSVPASAPAAVAAASVTAPAAATMTVASVAPDAPTPQAPEPAMIAKVARASIAAHRPMVATIPVAPAPTLPALPAADTMTKAPVVVASAASSIGSAATSRTSTAAAAPSAKRNASWSAPRARAPQPAPPAAPPAPPPLIITPKPIAPSARVAMQQAKAAAHDSATVAALVATHEDELAECYRQFGLRYNPDLAGPLALGIESSDSGTVTAVRVVHRSWDGPAPADVEQCVRTNVRGWRFAPAAADTIALTLRFTP